MMCWIRILSEVTQWFEHTEWHCRTAFVQSKDVSDLDQCALKH